MKSCIIFNPTARGERAARFQELLSSLSSQCALKPTFAAGSGQRLAAEAVRDGFETIVAAGGDGTLNEVLNGIAAAPDGFQRARLAVLPLGTVNVFAKELRLPQSLKASWKVIQAGKETWIDVGRADFTGPNGQSQRYFIQLAGAGWDARAVELVSWAWKKKIGALAYVTAGLKALGEPLPRIQVEQDSVRVEGQLVLLGNGAYYAGRWRLFPKASLCDGLLEVSIFPQFGWFHMMRGATALLAGQITALGGARFLRARTIRLSSAERVPFHLDGEYAGCLPADFTIEERKLRVIVP